MTSPDLLLDVSRLIWRASTGRLPTGIDRVCLAYVEHYRSRARAVVQYRTMRRVLPLALSEKLFDLLLVNSGRFRQDAARLAMRSLTALRAPRSQHGAIYLNIGHTGLNQPGLSEWLAAARTRPVFMLHDVIPISHPEYCRVGERERHAARMATMLRTGAGLICNSAATRDAAASYALEADLPLPATEIAWLGTTPLPAIDTPPAPDHPYFVMLGTIEGRKNHLLMLQIWRELVEAHGEAAPRLLIVGQRGWEAEQALAMIDRARALRGFVTELPRCTDDELAGLLRGARALLFPSFVEGFGMPLVEALAHGTPVIASDIGVFRELAGPVPEYAAPTDGRSWRELIEIYASDNSRTRAAQITRLAGFHAPTWAAHFATVDSWLETLPAL